MVTKYVDERGEGNRGMRGGGSRQGRGIYGGGGSGDLQVQLEQQMTLMVH